MGKWFLGFPGSFSNQGLKMTPLQQEISDVVGVAVQYKQIGPCSPMGLPCKIQSCVPRAGDFVGLRGCRFRVVEVMWNYDYPEEGKLVVFVMVESTNLGTSGAEPKFD